jgi:hypothetical protein
MRAILLLIAVMISYGSLYPFHFAANHHWLAEAAGLFSMPTLRMGRGDLVGNLLLFVPYGLVAVHVDTRGQCVPAAPDSSRTSEPTG